MKKAIVLGANGYIARNLVCFIQREYPDHELKLYGIENSSIDGFTNYKKVDMTDRESVKQIDLDVDYVYMFVGKTGSINGFEEYDSFIDINEKSLLNLLHEYKQQNSKAKIVFPSTRLVYKGKNSLQHEEDEKELKTIYAINKYSCEQYLKRYHMVYGIEYVIFRICVPYGTMVPGASSYGTAEFMLSKAMKGEKITIYGDGSVRRTLTYIEDLCKIIVLGTLSNKSRNDVYNIGGEDYSLKEMALLIAKKYNVNIDYVSWPKSAKIIESGDTVFDSSKLDSIIGKNNDHSFEKWLEC